MDSETHKSANKQVKTTTMDVIPNKPLNKGSWTPEEDRKLSEVIAVHGPKKWKTIANKAGTHYTQPPIRNLSCDYNHGGVV